MIESGENKKCYINGLGCISAQNTHDNSFFDHIINYENEAVLPVVKPNYKDFISPGAIRRMSSAVKNGIVASKLALKEAGVTTPDAIITGTGMGCMQDSEKFLKNIIDNQEDFLTPTSFIQSTHNTVAGQIALDLKCKSYNFNYVNSSVSFESSLLDALLQLKTGQSDKVLLGGVDEQAEHTIKLNKLIHFIKTDKTVNHYILNQRSKGAVFGQGAAFFLAENEKKENTYCELKDILFTNRLENDEFNKFISDFLAQNKINKTDIDLVLLGNNGDIDFDHYYDLASDYFKNSQQLYFKHLFGEFMTVSGVGFWLLSKIMKGNKIPEELKYNTITPKKINYALIYNQYRGKDHSLTLLKNV